MSSFEELQDLIGNYIEEYNNDRYQWGLNKMTPVTIPESSNSSLKHGLF